jgi:hypothetical protein
VLLLTVVDLFELGRRDLAVGFEEALVVEPVDPFEGGVLDVLEAAPRSSVADQFGLVEPDDRLGAAKEPSSRVFGSMGGTLEQGDLSDDDFPRRSNEMAPHETFPPSSPTCTVPTGALCQEEWSGEGWSFFSRDRGL